MSEAWLREVAEKATLLDWGVEDGEVWGQEADGQPVLIVRRASTDADAEHIATFDPPTVLALLDALADREARLAEVEALCDRWRAMGCVSVYESAEELAQILNEALHPDPSEAAQGGDER